MSEEIEIGLDASGALRGLSQLGGSFESLARSAGISDREITRSLNHMEKGIATVNAAVVKQAAAHVQNVKAIQDEAAAQSKLTAEQERAARILTTQKTGLTKNSSGQVVNASTGRFSGESSRYEAELANQRAAIQMQTQLENKLADLRQANARRSADAARMETAEYKAREQVLTRAFSGNIIASPPDASKWEKLSNVMRQIPPVTWAKGLNDATSKFMDLGNSARYALYDVSTSFGVAGAAVAGLGVLAISAAVAHERAFANVQRTTQTTTAGYEALRRQLEVMSMELPVTFEGLTDIATSAAQLGISASGVASFTSTVAKLTATTNLTAEAAGIALARFRSFFSTAETSGMEVTEATFSNLASSILKVGVNSIASETGIVNVATQIASMGSYAGMSANQVIGLAGAMSSIGVAPELSRGTITRTFSLIGQAVSENGVKLEKFAALAGISASDFRAAWGTEAFAGVFTQLVGGIKAVGDSGQDANQALMDLGFNSVRDRPILLRLAEAADEANNSGGLLAQTMRDAESGWRDNIELSLQYSKISNTTAARLQVLGQAFEQLASSMGQQSGGFLGEIAQNLTGVVRMFEEMSNSDAGQIFGTISVQAALAVGGLMLLVAGAARVVASMQGIGQAAKLMSEIGISSLTKLSGAFRILSLSMGIVGVLGAIAGVVAGFIAMEGANAKANRAIQDTGGLVQAMATDAKNGAEGITFVADASGELAAEQRKAEKQANDMAESLYGIKPSADAGAAGMENLADASERAKYVFGQAAKDFFRSSLAQNEAFQSLFDPDKSFASSELDNFFGRGITLKDLGVTPDMFDWDDLMEQSVKGTFSKQDLLADLVEATGTKVRDVSGQFTKEYVGLSNVVNTVGTAIGDVNGDIQTEIGLMAALEKTAQQTYEQYNEGATDAAGLMSKLDEVTQKAINNMATGFAKFTDTKGLIGLTQTFAAGDAEEFEKAWTNAYGGASFSLQQYLDVQNRAGEEQSTFIANLQELSTRTASLGISDAFIADLAAMGPEANRLVQALVNGTDEQLTQFVDNFGRTGYDASVALAVQMELGQEIIRNIMANGGTAALREFNAKLSSGVGVNEALAQMQRNVDGTPIIVKPQTDTPANLTWAQKKLWEEQNRLNTTATVKVTAINGGAGVKIGGKIVTPEGYSWATGGYTGAGGKYEPAGVVHKDEFVMTKEATRAIGVSNLYAMMNAATRGRSAPRGRGYAQGGLVGGGGGIANAGFIASFGPMAMQQLMQAMRVQVALDGERIADNSAGQFARDSAIGAY